MQTCTRCGSRIRYKICVLLKMALHSVWKFVFNYFKCPNSILFFLQTILSFQVETFFLRNRTYSSHFITLKYVLFNLHVYMSVCLYIPLYICGGLEAILRSWLSGELNLDHQVFFFFTAVSISLLVTGLFRLTVHVWLSCLALCLIILISVSVF